MLLSRIEYLSDIEAFIVPIKVSLVFNLRSRAVG